VAVFANLTSGTRVGVLRGLPVQFTEEPEIPQVLLCEGEIGYCQQAAGRPKSRHPEEVCAWGAR
jgi:hypothetical protein